MMIMTIWWSKATRLLEFSRSSVSRTLRHEEEVGPGFFVTEEELGILVSGYRRRVWALVWH